MNVSLIVGGLMLVGGVAVAGCTSGTKAQRHALATASTSAPQATAAPTVSCEYGSDGDGSCLASPEARRAGTVQDLFLAAAHTRGSAGKVNDETLLQYGATVCAVLDATNGDVARTITSNNPPKAEQLAVVRDAANYLCPQWNDAAQQYQLR